MDAWYGIVSFIDDTQGVYPDPISVTTNLRPALAIAATSDVPYAIHALGSVFKYQANNGGLLPDLIPLESTNCPWLSDGPYRNP